MRYSGLGVHSLGPVGDFLENETEVVYQNRSDDRGDYAIGHDSTYRAQKNLVELMIGPHNSIDN